jgi:hypothetical protein
MGVTFPFTPKTMKSDLTKTPQPPGSYAGQIEQWIAGGSINNGDIVIRSLVGEKMHALTATSVPQSYDIIGISLGDAVAGNHVNIMKNGYCTAKYTTQHASPQINLLDMDYSDQPAFTDLKCFFRDSGNVSVDYGSGQEYCAAFDAGVGQTWTLKFVTDPKDVSTFFEFEHSTFSMYDRLGVQQSTDGINWENMRVSWMQTSSAERVPWGESFGGSSWNSSRSVNGWILPKDVPRAALLGYKDDSVENASRFVRFCFISDTSTTAAGWNIEMTSSGYQNEGSPLPVANNVPVYVDATAPEKISTTGTVEVGRTAYTDALANSVFIRVL